VSSSENKSLLATPEAARVLPFAVFLLIPALGAKLLPNPDYWLYALKIGAVSLLLYWLRPRLPEMKWSFSWAAVGVGLGVAVLWELLSRNVPGLTRIYEYALHWTTGRALPPVKPPEGWTPLTVFRNAPALAYCFIALRILGRSLVVPLIEEVFYRSFVYRYIIQPKFESVPLTLRHNRAWLLTSALFALAHPDQWLAGLVCGLAYQWLVIRSGRLGDAILAHAITNGLLSAWVIYRGTWDFS
jgi:CAAX prenyl protease-like protein